MLKCHSKKHHFRSSCALISDLIALVQHLGCLWLLLNHKMVLKKSQEDAKYPLYNMRLGHSGRFAGLGFLGFSFGGRRSKLFHEAGAVAPGERSLEQAGGDIFPRTLNLLCSLLQESPGACGGEVPGLGGAAEAEIGEMESVRGRDLPALTFLADKAPHLSP